MVMKASGVTEVNKRRKRTVKSEDGVQKLVGTLTLQEPLKEIRNLRLFSSGYLPLISLQRHQNSGILLCLLLEQ
jgi:hypothetical protein